MIKEEIVSKLIDKAIDLVLSKAMKEKDFSIKIDKTRIEESLTFHMSNIQSWSADISLPGLSELKTVKQTFFEIDLALTRRKWNLTSNPSKNINVSEILTQNANCIVLGDPGSGKTTTLKYLCQKLLFDDSPMSGKFNYPVLIKLRDLDSNESVLERLQKIIGFQVLFKQNQKSANYFSLNSLDDKPVNEKIKIITEDGRLEDINKLTDEQIRDLIKIKDTERIESFLKNNQLVALLKRIITSIIDEQNIAVLLDGLDELNPTKYKKVILEFEYLTSNCSKTKFFLSCRSGAFDYSFQNCQILEICPLSRDQVHLFISKWLQNDEQTKILYNKIYELPYIDTASRPLTLAHLCAIYERFHDIPEKPKSVYRKVVNLFLEEWDNQHMVNRFTKYAGFDTDRKFEFLCNLAYNVTVQTNRTTFSHDQLKQIYKSLCGNFNLPINECFEVATEIESHTGLVVQSGYESFEFSHKSIQEYLTAHHLVNLPKLPTRMIRTANIPNELAISVCISSNRTDFFASLVFEQFHQVNFNRQFINTFISRLIIEKPEFSNDPLIFIGIMYLYEKIALQANLDSMSQMAKNNITDEIFRELLSSIATVDLISDFCKYYKFIDYNKSLNYLTFQWVKPLINDVITELPSVHKIYLTILPDGVVKHLSEKFTL